jgi:acyl-CoA reductase-like NAD-dependent aldehyde dehydrogenase
MVTSHRDAADYLVRHAGIDKVSFTGSVAAGRRIASVCGDRIARYTLELGGKSAAILLDDCDVGAVARTLAEVITMSAGQVCATLSRALVSRRRHDELIDALRTELAAIHVGDPYDPAARMGPLAMDRQRARVEEYVSIGQAEGATLVHGGGRPGHLAKGYYFEPTLFTGVTCGMRIAQEEIFGPVLSVLTYEDEADAVRIANDSPFGLYGAVFTEDQDRAYRIARGVRTGTVSHNGFRFDPTVPFGGFKQSGIGREGGEAGLTGFTEAKSILLAAR